MIVIDENVEKYWIDLIRRKGHEVLAIVETTPGISDSQVLRVVQKNNDLLVTEDKILANWYFLTASVR